MRGVRLHVRRWGNPDAPMLFMLHGWMDVAASFQFVVDALGGDWQVIAPDMRGFGLSDWPVAERGGGNYWFHDYLADLDALLDHYAPTGQVNLVGHSLGANIVCLYAGVRPERVRRVVDLEGFGLAPSHSAQAPQTSAQLARRIARSAAAEALRVARRRSRPARSRPIHGSTPRARSFSHSIGRSRTAKGVSCCSPIRRTSCAARRCTGSTRSWPSGAR